jgi:hypothetical protein
MIMNYFFLQTSIFRHLHGCEAASERFFQVFYDKMCIAQKALKSMPSTTSDITQDNDDLDDMVFTPKYHGLSSMSTSNMNDHGSLSTHEPLGVDQQSTSMASLISLEHTMKDDSNSQLLFIVSQQRVASTIKTI